jgi:hypothetical protein
MRFTTTLGIAATALCLYGCASGGGSSGGGGGTGNTQPVNTIPPAPAATAPPPPSPPPAASDAFRTPEYNLMGGLDAIHAAEAYARGYTGLGVIVGVVDFNFDFTSTEVTYNPASVGPNSTALALYAAQTGRPNDTDQHGHAIAATIAAHKNDSGIHGVAFNATILGVDYFSDVNETRLTQGGILYHISDPFTYLTSRGAHIVNTSYGYEGGSSGGLGHGIHEAYVTESPAIAVANGALLVASAGNASGSQPAKSNFDIIADLQDLGILDQGPGAFIIAGAVNSSNVIASFSDRAGSLANYYLVAPGVGLILPWNGSLASLSGTSFPAPLISGAAAILLERWPTLTGKQVADILLQSATDLGAPGVDAVYGHGLLNIDAALQPVGTTTFATSDGIGSTAVSTGMVLGMAFGDAPQFRAALSSATILDGYGRDFALNLSGAAVSRPSAPDLFGVMQQKLGWHFAGLPLGGTSQFDFELRENPVDGIVPFGPAGGLEASLAEHQAVARFAGELDGIGWMAGTGLSLRDALAPQDASDPFTTLTLTQGFMSAVGGMPSSFAGLSLALDTDRRISIGVSHEENQGIPAYDLPRQFHNAGQAVAVRFDQRMGNASFGLEAGGLMEDGGVLGSLASGALKMTDGSTTSWLSASYAFELPDRWSLKGAMSVSATGANKPVASLLTSIGPVYASSFALGLGRSDVFGAGDALSFVVDQPLRAERAPVALALGAGLNVATGKVAMVGSDASLVPSGREIDFESGYRFPIGAWNGAVNIAYSLDAGHVRGENAALGLIWISRTF